VVYCVVLKVYNLILFELQFVCDCVVSYNFVTNVEQGKLIQLNCILPL